MIKLYNDEDLRIIEKKKKQTLFFMILCLALFVVGLTVFLIVSTYHTRVLFSVLASVIETVVILFALYFIFKFNYLKKTAYEYKSIKELHPKKVECEVLECSDFVTTLLDRSKCHELLVKIGDKEVIYYLSELFNYKDLKEGKAVIYIANDYVVGYEYEA